MSRQNSNLKPTGQKREIKIFNWVTLNMILLGFKYMGDT